MIKWRAEGHIFTDDDLNNFAFVQSLPASGALVYSLYDFKMEIYFVFPVNG